MNEYEYQSRLCDAEARMDWLESRSQQLAADYAMEYATLGTIEQYVSFADWLKLRSKGESLREFFVANLQSTVDETAEEIIARLATEQAEREIDQPGDYE